VVYIDRQASSSGLPDTLLWNNIPRKGILAARRRTSGKAAAGSKVRCVFRRDSGSLTFDVPPSETSAWRAVARVLRSPMDALGCASLPASCALCGSPPPHPCYAPICAACWSEIPVGSNFPSARCGGTLDAPSPVVSSAPEALCRICRPAPPAFVRAVSFGAYGGRKCDAVHARKYDRLTPAARLLGHMLASAIATLARDRPSEMLVIPVPLHRSKYTARGFNQARATVRALLKAGAERVWIAARAGARRIGASAHNAFKAADDQLEIGEVADSRARQASMYSQNQPSF
jgi:predicted amidophosphoribosyltransferase